MKYFWKTVQDKWEKVDLPPDGATANPHISLQPHRENALIEALYEVSSPGPPKHVLSTTPPRAQLGALGVSILIATGDWGVGEGNCETDGQV